MIEVGGGFGLGGETLDLGLGREHAAEDHLQRDGSADGDLAGFEDDAHAALGDALDELVVADALFEFGFVVARLAEGVAEEAAGTEPASSASSGVEQRGQVVAVVIDNAEHGKWQMENGKWSRRAIGFPFAIYHLPFSISACSLLRQRREKVTDFFVHLRGGMDRVADLEPQEILVTLAEAMDGGLERGLGHVERRGGFGVAFVALAPQVRLDRLEEFFLVARRGTRRGVERARSRSAPSPSGGRRSSRA